MTLVFGMVGNDWSSVQNRESIAMFASLNLVLNSVQNVVYVFPSERAVFFKEQTNALYSPSAYYFAKFLSEVPGMIINPTLFTIIVYFGCDLNQSGSSHFFIFLLISILLTFASSTFAMIMGALFKDRKVAMSMIYVMVIPQGLFTGFLIHQNDIPDYMIPLEYLSMFKYSYQAYLLNELDGTKINWSYRDVPKDLGFNETLTQSIILLFSVGILWMIVSYILLILIAKCQRS